MSLNRAEQTIHDYVMQHPDELRYWQEKVTRLAATAPNHHAAADAVADALLAYCRERAAVLPAFRPLAEPGGPTRLMLRSLAELLVRRWAPPPAKKPPLAEKLGR